MFILYFYIELYRTYSIVPDAVALHHPNSPIGSGLRGRGRGGGRGWGWGWGWGWGLMVYDGDGDGDGDDYANG